MKLSEDLIEFLFRALFCLIFVGLGFEHIFSDTLLQHLMPQWVPFKRLVSISCGMWLLLWGSLILIGYHVRHAALALGVFLVVVTILVHLPGIFYMPVAIPAESQWMWTVLQRSNLAKNICLLGVCLYLRMHKLGKYSAEYYLARKPGGNAGNVP